MKRLAIGLLLAAGTACGQTFISSTTAGGPNLQQKFQQARAAYFRDLQGDRGAEQQARQDFDQLMRARPNDPTIVAYSGSLELLEAARTWAFWNKHTLAKDGLGKMDEAVSMDPDDLEARFIRGATNWHLPFFFHRKQQAEDDLSFVGPRAEHAAETGKLPPPLAAAALDYYGQILEDRNQRQNARSAFEAAVRVDRNSPGGKDAADHLKSRS
jgi:tetratricopeptide (TPR) repeat protein